MTATGLLGKRCTLALLIGVATGCPNPTGSSRGIHDAGRDANDARRDTIHAGSDSADAGGAVADAGNAALWVDIRSYWARAGVLQTYRKWNGTLYGHYRFTEHTSGPFLKLYKNLYDQGHPGSLVSWEKRYPKGDSFCIPTYGLLWFGHDSSVTEVGDWFAGDGCTPDRAFGYRSADGQQNLGLTWSPPGGVTTHVSKDVEVRVYRQAGPGMSYVDSGFDAYSSVVLLGKLKTWTAPYGRDSAGQWQPGAGATYSDVVQLVLYHGTRSPKMRLGQQAPLRCGPKHLDQAWPRAALYRSYGNYNSYAIELYLARGVGVVSEALLFTESDYWGAANLCRGAIMGQDHQTAERTWTSYLDP